ncbi:hypothetical protein ACTOVN_05840 [Arcanobacterium canis]
MKKSLAVVAALCSLALTACSSMNQPTTTAGTTPSASASASSSASAKPTVKKYPTLKSTQKLKAEAVNGGTAYTTVDGAVTLTAPAGFTALTKGTNPLSEVWLSSGKTQILLSKLGKPLTETTKEDYLALLAKGDSFKDFDVKPSSDVTIDGISAWSFELTKKQGATHVAQIYVVEHRGVTYEVTVKAEDQAGFSAAEKIILGTKLNGQG